MEVINNFLEIKRMDIKKQKCKAMHSNHFKYYKNFSKVINITQ